MNTPEEEFNTIINKFNEALSHMGPGMGDPVTRGERALLKTFYLFLIQQGYEEHTVHSSDADQETQTPG